MSREELSFSAVPTKPEFEWEQMRRVLPPGDWPDVYGGTLDSLLAKRGAR